MSAGAVAIRRRLTVVPTIDGLWALIAVAVPTAAAFAGRMMAIDLAYLIRAGSVMLDTHRVLDIDVFTFTAYGRPWLNQQWGADVLFALIYRAGGWTGIAVTRGLFVAILVLLLYRSCRAVGASPRTAALLTLASCCVGIEILPAMRPQLLGFVLFALVLWILSTRHESPYRIWWIPPIVAVWANLHGSFPLAILLIGFAWLEDHGENSDLARRHVLVAAASVLASFVNPFGPRVWPYALNLLTDPDVVREVAEWGPPSIHTITGLFFFASILMTAWFLARRPVPTAWIPLLKLGVFAGIGLLAIRGVGWWALIAPVAIAEVVKDDLKARDVSRPPVHLAIAALIVALVLVTLPVSRGRDPRSGGPAKLTYAPEDLVSAAARAAGPDRRVFVSQLYASWTEFAAPSLLVAVDPRIELFPARVWADYFLVSDGREGWEEVLDLWDVRTLVLEPGQAEGLLQILPQHQEWRLVIRTPLGSVYERS